MKLAAFGLAFLATLHQVLSQLPRNSVGAVCNGAHPKTNAKVVGCCKFPNLFSTQIMEKCKPKGMRGTQEGTSGLYQDSCYLQCLFGNAGINMQSDFDGSFIRRAVPYSLSSPKTIISWSASADTIARQCHEEFRYKNNRAIFMGLYRQALNRINPDRPVCNPKLAAFWDCVMRKFMLYCEPPFLGFSNQLLYCLTIQRFTKSCEWWSRY